MFENVFGKDSSKGFDLGAELRKGFSEETKKSAEAKISPVEISLKVTKEDILSGKFPDTTISYENPDMLEATLMSLVTDVAKKLNKTVYDVISGLLMLQVTNDKMKKEFVEKLLGMNKAPGSVPGNGDFLDFIKAVKKDMEK